VPPRFFVLHHAGEKLFRREIVAGFVEQRFGIGFKDARDEAPPHLRAAGVTAGRIESEAANRLAVAFDVGEDRDHRGCHLGEIKARIGERGIERDRGLADIDDAHWPSFSFSPRAGRGELYLICGILASTMTLCHRSTSFLM
jgi:hypothetical protein